MKTQVTFEFFVDMDGTIHEQFEADEETLFLKDIKKENLENQRLIAIPAPINGHIHSADYKLVGRGYGKSTSRLVGRQGLKKDLLANMSVTELKKTIKAFMERSETEGSLVIFDFREGGVVGSRIAREATEENNIQVFILGRTQNVKELWELRKWADGIGIPDATRWSRETIEELVEQAKGLNMFTAIHVSETKKSRDRFLEQEGESDIEFALDLDIDMLVHLTHATQRDLESVIRSEAIPVFCPRSNGFLSNGIPPVLEFLRKNSPFLLGTDNAFISSPNIFREADYLARLVEDKKAEYLNRIFQAITGTHPKLIERFAKRLPSFKRNTYLILAYPTELDKEDLISWVVLHAHPGVVKGFFQK